MNMTPEIVKALKEEGVNEPEYYLVVCDTHEEALIVAEFFDTNKDDNMFIKNISPARFPIKVGRLSNNKFITLRVGEYTRLSANHETIDFKNWHTIRKEDTSSEELYKRLGMEL